MKEPLFKYQLSTITKVKTISNYLYNRIIELGFDVFLFTSKKSKSRYLEIFIEGNEKINVRISDHPPDYVTKYYCNYDIYNKEPREGAINFIKFLENFIKIYGNYSE